MANYFKFNDELLSPKRASDLLLAVMLYPNQENMQSSWIIKYQIAMTDRMYLDYKQKYLLTDDEAHSLTSFIHIWSYVKALGGWNEYKKMLLCKNQYSFKEETKLQAIKGMISGKILSLAISNCENISKACADAIKQEVIIMIHGMERAKRNMMNQNTFGRNIGPLTQLSHIYGQQQMLSLNTLLNLPILYILILIHSVVI